MPNGIEIKNSYERESLGRPAVFYLPSLKINNPQNKKLKNKLHDFLLREFNGFTTENGHIIGYWMDSLDEGSEEHVKYTVSFKGKERIPILEEFLVDIAKKLSEKAIYMETGEDSWLLYPKSEGR